MKGSNFFCEPTLMFDAASFSLRSLFVLRPLVRGGEGAENSSESEVSSDEGTKDASPPGLRNRHPNLWDLSSSQGKQVLEKLPPRY